MSAAQSLIDDNNYASSVHCSYYGCFQFLKHKLNILGHSYEAIDLAIRESTSPESIKNGVKRLATHTYPVKLIQHELNVKHNDGGFLGRKVTDKIKLLKAFRTLSDYHNVSVDYTKGVEALQISKEVLNIIKTQV